ACRSKDPMDPYRNMGAPRGFARDSYKEITKKDQPVKRKKTNKSFFGKLFEDEQEKKRKFRDVSKPMESGTVEIFPWRGEDRRSNRLHQEIRRENKRREGLYW
ncbi:MAG: hypothetical protein IKA79_01250, partial [Lentisphaeria bacterium]|nr:hypothetical protein [Lentisphaeria bacterium]